jgi:hypothetical protein
MLPLYLPWMALLRLAAALQFRQRRRGGPGRLPRGGATCRPILLVSPRLIEDDRVELIEDDILNNREIRGAYHVVRAANILNRSYFDEPDLIAILDNLRRRLVAGGLLVVCSTTEPDGEGRPAGERNHGTVFALRPDGRLEVAGRLGDGSSVEPLALGLAAIDA